MEELYPVGVSRSSPDPSPAEQALLRFAYPMLPKGGSKTCSDRVLTAGIGFKDKCHRMHRFLHRIGGCIQIIISIQIKPLGDLPTALFV